MVVSSDPGWLQGAFSTLSELFYWLCLRKNSGKTVGMVFCLCQAAGNQLVATHERRLKGAGLSYRERERVRVQCSECGEEMEFGFLEVHLQMHHGKEAVWKKNWRTTAPGGDPHN